jgi:pimeloyl-ACP methyl ester carboxylesterase
MPSNPLGEELHLASWSGPQPSPRTMQVLRVYNLADDFQSDTRDLLVKLRASTANDTSPDTVYACAELSYLGGLYWQKHDPEVALDMYGATVLESYDYLFNDRFAAGRNAYDPHFRGACDLYNAALEAALRIANKNGKLRAGTTATIHTARGNWEVECVLRGGVWQPEDIEHFEFASDYEVHGLRNKYQSHGLGVPLIAVRHAYAEQPAAARYYPTDLSFPVTAFIRPLSDTSTATSGARCHGLLELCDPLSLDDTSVGNLRVPLESDLSTPLAYFLAKVPLEKLATEGLFRPDLLLDIRQDRQAPVMGMYMVQPYEPGKIPVVMIHGLWSSPMTWMEMFNDLRADPEIRRHYQFWFYLYPTGQPFWVSAAQLRHDLAELRGVVDPQRREPALDQMVLVGHSMGGLVARMQTIESGDEFWNLASHLPLEQIKAEPVVKDKIRDVFYFHANPSIRQVVTIATPHHGSNFSNQTTQYLLGKVIRMPSTIATARETVFRDNPDLLFPGSLLEIQNSIDSLSPTCPILPLLLSSPHPPTVQYHNIIGQIPTTSLWSKALGTNTDGVVTSESAYAPDAAPPVVVPSEHMKVQMHPVAVLEVHRILLQYLGQLRAEGAPTYAHR